MLDGSSAWKDYQVKSKIKIVVEHQTIMEMVKAQFNIVQHSAEPLTGTRLRKVKLAQQQPESHYAAGQNCRQNHMQPTACQHLTSTLAALQSNEIMHDLRRAIVDTVKQPGGRAFPASIYQDSLEGPGRLTS